MSETAGVRGRALAVKPKQGPRKEIFYGGNTGSENNPECVLLLASDFELMRLALLDGEGAGGEAQAQLRDALDFIARNGYRRCDIPACNCGSWHGGHASERLSEIADELDTNGVTILGAVRATKEALATLAAFARTAPGRLPAAVQAAVDLVPWDGSAVAALAPAVEPPTPAWQPIESAPKDGTEILLSGVGSKRWIGTGHWFRRAWRDDGPGELGGVTHWMPLPAAPTDEADHG